MADKRLRLIVEAVTSQAQQKLREFSNEIKLLGQQSREGGKGLDDLADQAVELQRRAAAAKDEARQLREEIDGTSSSLDLMGTATSAATDAIVFLGAGFAALKLGEKAVDLARVAAANLAVADSFEALAARSQIDSKLLLKALDEAARGTISDTDLMREANEAWYLGIAQNVKQYSDLMKIAEQKSKDLGISTLNYWQRLTNAVSSGYPGSLKQLGVVIDMDRAYESYGATIGRAADDLTEHEQILARVNAIIAEGEPTLRDWEQTEVDATTATQAFDVATANLSDTIKQQLLPVLLPAMNWITKGLQGIEAGTVGQNKVIGELIESTGSAAAAEKEFANNIMLASGGLIDQAEAARLAHIAMVDYRLDLIGIDKGIQEDIRAMRMGEQATLDFGRSQRELAEDTEEAAKAAEKAEDAWSTYLRNVAEQNWRFGRRVEDAQFRAAQAAERAAFQLYEIERDAGDRRRDLLESVAIRVEADTARHYNKLRYMRQDLLDELADMEYDYQQDRSDLLRQAPYWIRNALVGEYKERDRIAATGDKKALKAFDKQLRERIRAIDPAYAQELDLLEEHYSHQEEVETREAGQARQRQQQDWAISSREQDRSLDLQLRQLERALGYRLESWHFNQAQREASEKWSMERMLTEHDHQLGRMYDDTQTRLSQLPDLYKHYGYASWIGFVQGLADAQTDAGLNFSPFTGDNPFTNYVNPFAQAQQGIDYVPRTMPVIIHKGETVLPAPEAQRYREGGVSIHIETMHVAGGRAGAKQFVRQIEEELGQGIRRRSR